MTDFTHEVELRTTTEPATTTESFRPTHGICHEWSRTPCPAGELIVYPTKVRDNLPAVVKVDIRRSFEPENLSIDADYLLTPDEAYEFAHNLIAAAETCQRFPDLVIAALACKPSSAEGEPS